MRILLAAALLYSVPAQAANDDAVRDAIAKGARFLESQDYKSGEEHGIGPMCLAGVAMMEADVKPGTPTLAKIHNLVRVASIREIGTYQVSLAILFLDRYGDANDHGIIQILGARLLAGQTLAGGWNYQTFDPIDEAEAARIVGVLSAPPRKGYLNSEASRIIVALNRGARPSAALAGDDNSNTQFALMALWAARRSGLPTNAAFNRLQARFLRTQSNQDGGWNYQGREGNSTPAMTCAGLLGLAVSKAAGEAELTAVKGADEKRSPDDDPFIKPPQPGKPAEEADAPPTEVAIEAVPPNQRDQAIERALAGLGKLLVQDLHLRATTDHGGLSDIYFAWSLERVAVAYGLDTIGGIDWHEWGCKGLLPVQKPNGCWSVGYSEKVDTAFALLFLKKANLTADLTRKIQGKIKDPGGAELRGNRGKLPAAIDSAGTKQETIVVDGKRVPINTVRTTDAADRIAAGLVNAIDGEWPTRLKAARETKGPQNTAGLVLAIGGLEGKRLYQAREALAERLTRMDSDTLKRMLSERDAELRRAACLAVAMKDDVLLAPGVIANIRDPNDSVVRAARAALRAMSSEDRGPPSGSDEDEKRKAAEDWQKWYENRKR